MRHIGHISDVPVSRNWYKTVSKLYQNVFICKILFKIHNIKQIVFNKCATNLKTTIFQRSLRNSFLIVIIDNIIYASGTCHQNSNQWQSSIIVMCLRLYHMISIHHCHWREFLSHDTDVYLTYIRFGIILTQFYVNFSRQEHLIDVL